MGLTLLAVRRRQGPGGFPKRARLWGGWHRGGPQAARFLDYCGHRAVAMVRVCARRSDAFADHAGDGLF